MSFQEAVASRVVGQYPLSVATSLAIESACGIHPDLPVDRAPLVDYPELWVNVRTLFRNLVGAIEKEALKRVTPQGLAEALAYETEILKQLIDSESHQRTKVHYYVSNYNIEHLYRFGVIRRDNTPRQKEYTAIQTKTLEYLFKLLGPQAIQVFDAKLKTQHAPRALLLTHYAYDLLSSREFSHLTLLESHTGAIKERAQWYTKYYQGKALSMIPFREDFIQIFGDNETFRPGDPDLRKAIIDIATKYRWTAVTTREKIVYGINQLQNPYYKATLRDILV